MKGPIKDHMQKYDRDSGLANAYLHVHFPYWSSARLWLAVLGWSQNMQNLANLKGKMLQKRPNRPRHFWFLKENQQLFVKT